MPVPSYLLFIEPLLRCLAKYPEGMTADAAHKAAAAWLQLTEDDLREEIRSGQLTYKNRAGWAHDRLKRAGLSSTPKRGIWRLTGEGFQFVTKFPAPCSEELIAKIADLNTDRPLGHPSQGGILSYLTTQEASQAPAPNLDLQKSPDERLASALEEIQSAIVRELLEIVGRVSPRFFESMVLDLLHAMGYGANRSDIQRVGGSGDGGIDGIISLDRLGLEKVYVQAKRWQANVGRPEVQAFYGALAGQRANKGVFITTSGFTLQAIEFAKTVEKIILIDGNQFASLCVEFGVGTSHRAIRLPRIDSDYFEE